VLIVLVACLLGAQAFLANRIERPYAYYPEEDVDEGPLNLSDWLHDPLEARRLCAVHGIGMHPSYSAFFNVNKSTDSSMYWWFFPAQNGDEKAPFIVFLEGGPGVSSLLSLFYQMGPFTVSSNGTTLIDNPYTWNKEFAMLFIDNPVGAGFSYTHKPAGFTTNEHHVAHDLYSLLEQFYTVFPSYKANELYIVGESYGGHFVPAIAHEIHVQNQRSPKHVMNLKGVVLGDPSLDPLIQMSHFGSLLFDLGLVDENEATQFTTYGNRISEAILHKDFVKAFYIFDEMMGGDFYHYGSLYANTTSLPDYYNYMTPSYPLLPFPIFLNMPTTRRALHVGNTPYWVYNTTVEHYMIPDFMTDITPFLLPIMNNYKVMVYSGQLDIILGPALTEKYLWSLKWKGLQSYRNAIKQHWYLDNDNKNNYVAGYVRQAHQFTQVTLRKAGHMTIVDAPKECLDMMNRFIYDQPWAIPKAQTVQQ
jgi:vitellogenic carboxypeptidase-like protein